MSYQAIKYEAKDYSSLKGLSGITDEQIEVHLKLYQGYVNRTNALLEKLASLANAGTADSSFQELKRRAGWEFNGMRLHEYYFDNLTSGAAPLAADSAFAQAVSKQFGSVDAWKSDLMNTGKMPGVGWVITYKDNTNGQLINQWIEKHESGHPAGCQPLLVLDCWEHAFSVYRKPTDRPAYLDDFYANVNWVEVASRL